MKNKFLLIIFTFFLAFSNFANAYTQLNERQTSILFPSEKRFVYSLAGSWERSEDNSEWEPVKLPNTEVTNKKVSFRRLLKISRDMRESYAWQLHFLGIDHQVEVYINDQFVGRYFGSLTPFEVRIPERMITSESNMLKLVFAPPTGASKQIKTQQLFAKEMYSGLIREVFLVGTPNIWVSKVDYTQEFNTDLSYCTLKGNFDISSGKVANLFSKAVRNDSLKIGNSDKINVNVVFELINPITNEVISSQNSRSLLIENERTLTEKFSIGINNPKLWSTEEPNLYQLLVKIMYGDIVIDDYRINVGFRKIHRKNDKLFLNNKEFKIKGVTYIEDYLNDIATLSPSRLEEDINLIKTLGANLVRFKFTSPHPYMAELCNKYGLFIMAELPCYDVPSEIMDLDEIKVNMKNIAKQFLSSYDRFPSMFAWGIASGSKEGSSGFLSFSKELTKVFSSESENLIYKVVPFGSNQINSEGFDFIGFKDARKNSDFNYINKEVKRLKELAGGIPTFFEYGIIVHPDNHNGYSDPLSVEFQAYNILNSFNIAKENNLSGSLVNTFNDYKLENPILLADNQNVYSGAFGLFDRQRQQRLSYNTLQSLYNEEAEPLLNAGSFKETTPISYIIIGLLLIIVLILLINQFKRFREYFFRSILRPYNFYADIRDQRIMSSALTIILSIIISMTLGIYISSIFFFYKTNELAQYIMMMLVKWDSVQEALYRIIWMPEITTLILTLVILIGIFLAALVIRVFALLLRARIFMNDAFTIVVWSLLPMILLLPVSIVLLRVLVISQSSIFIFLGLIAILKIWSLFRLLKSSAVVFDKTPTRVYLLGAAIIILLIVFPLGYYQIQYSLMLYAQYFMEVLIKM